MRRKPVRVQSAKSHIEDAALSKTPAVALHVGAEVELGYLAANDAFRIYLHLGLLGRDHDFAAHLRSQEPRDRAKCSARPNQQASPPLPVDDPFLAGPLQAGQWRWIQKPR